MKAVNFEAVFETETGKKIYSDICRAIEIHSMHTMLRGGVLAAFSGGADSVLMLCFLAKYRKEHGINIAAVHINHMIRGDEAVRDEEFSREFARALGIEFQSFSFDVPALAKLTSIGIEEMARNVRYSKFEKILQSRKDISCISVAHNSTDNLETVIFNMMRGAGARGLSGISPVRNNILRPLIFVSKEDIIKALNLASVPFVTDSTNFEIDYKRNYIRNEILPKLSHLTEKPEVQAERLSASLRLDNEFIEGCASEFIKNHKSENGIKREELSKLHSAVFSRVIIQLQKEHSPILPEYTHIEKIRALVINKGKEAFKVSLPAGLTFKSNGEFCCLSKALETSCDSFSIELKSGINVIPNSNDAILLSEEPFYKFSSNVYKMAIQQTVDFDIIVGKLSARSRNAGDSYIFGGMTRKLKKLFNDRKISVSAREKMPIICDEAGILFLPGFPVRDGGGKKTAKKLYIALLKKI